MMMIEPNASFARRINRDIGWLVEYKDITDKLIGGDLPKLAYLLLTREEGKEMVGYITGIMVSYLKELGITEEELIRRIKGGEF